MMKPATMERRILSLDASIRAIHGSIMHLQLAMDRAEDRLAALAADPGLEGDRSPSPPCRPAGPEDDAGGK